MKSVMDRAGIQLEMLSEEEEEQVQQALKDIEEELSGTPPKSRDELSAYTIKELKSLMNEAAKSEDYEKAAQIRDELEKRQQSDD